MEIVRLQPTSSNQVSVNQCTNPVKKSAIKRPTRISKGSRYATGPSLEKCFVNQITHQEIKHKLPTIPIHAATASALLHSRNSGRTLDLVSMLLAFYVPLLDYR